MCVCGHMYMVCICIIYYNIELIHFLENNIHIHLKIWLINLNGISFTLRVYLSLFNVQEKGKTQVLSESLKLLFILIKTHSSFMKG